MLGDSKSVTDYINELFTKPKQHIALILIQPTYLEKQSVKYQKNKKIRSLATEEEHFRMKLSRARTSKNITDYNKVVRLVARDLLGINHPLSRESN